MDTVFLRHKGRFSEYLLECPSTEVSVDCYVQRIYVRTVHIYTTPIACSDMYMEYLAVKIIQFSQLKIDQLKLMPKKFGFAYHIKVN